MLFLHMKILLLGIFFWYQLDLRIRATYEKTARIAVASNRVTDDCPKKCPCCGIGKQSFQH